MTEVDHATQVINTVRADSALLEADLRQFLAELPTSPSPMVDAALRAGFHEPVADALGSKVGQEALRPRGGAGFRPSLVYWVFRNYQGFDAEPTDVIRRVAVAIRILLKAAVVLDDIEDGSTVRYGEPALHTTHGVPFALNTGAWLVVAALDHAGEVAGALVGAVRNGFVGQAVDMSSRLPEVRRDLAAASTADRRRFWESAATGKTSTLFRMPSDAAATALGVPAGERALLDDAMRTMGFASQLFNDLTDFVPEFGAANTHEDFDGLTNRVCLELLDSTERVGDELQEYTLAHPDFGETLHRLAAEAVDLKKAAKNQLHELCHSADSAAYLDLTIDRKGHLMERLRDHVGEALA
jgi:geranylgeranyl pyrophosphate synthase